MCIRDRFEEAFFIVKSGQSAKKSTEEEFLGEAGRLVKAVPGAEQTADAFEKDKEKNESETSGERFRFLPRKMRIKATRRTLFACRPCRNLCGRTAEKGEENYVFTMFFCLLSVLLQRQAERLSYTFAGWRKF